MLITTAALNALRVQFEMRFATAYGETPVWHDKLATTVTSNAYSNVYGWIAQQIRMREWIGPRVALNLSEHSYTLVNKDYEATIELDRNEIMDDTLGMFTSVAIPQLAQAARKHPDVLIKEVLQSNSGLGPLAFDGLSFFNDAHFVNGKDTTGGTYDNSFALALTADNFNTVYTAMTQYVGIDGQLLGVGAGGLTLIIPSALKLTAMQLMNSTLIAQVFGANTAAAAIDNQLKGWANILEIPEFNNDPTRWYLADLSKPLKPVILQERMSDQFITRDNPQDPKVFDQKKFTYGVDNRRNVGVTLPFLMATSKP